MFAGMGESVTVWRAGPADRYGDRTWAVHHTVSDVLIDWSGSSMGRDRRAQDTTDLVLMFQSDPDVESTDRVEVRGSKYAPDGTIAPWTFGAWSPGVTIPVKRAEG